MKTYQEKVMDQILECKCYCCNRIYLKLEVHHINGDNKDNSEGNLIPICNRCHRCIHQGFKKYYSLLKGSAKENIIHLRLEILKKEFGELAEEKLKLERLKIPFQLQ